MDYRKFMQHAPRDCQPEVISRESILKDEAKRLGKKVEELTEEEKAAAFAPLNAPIDMYRS